MIIGTQCMWSVTINKYFYSTKDDQKLLTESGNCSIGITFVKKSKYHKLQGFSFPIVNILTNYKSKQLWDVDKNSFQHKQDLKLNFSELFQECC